MLTRKKIIIWGIINAIFLGISITYLIENENSITGKLVFTITMASNFCLLLLRNSSKKKDSINN